MSDSLQSVADDLCHSLRSRQLQHDRNTLAALGSGRLEIDLLKRTCRHGYSFIPRPMIADILLRRFHSQLAASDISTGAIRTAHMLIVLAIEEHEEQQDQSMMWFGEYRGFVGCRMEIRATISTADESRTSECRNYVEWPC